MAEVTVAGLEGEFGIGKTARRTEFGVSSRNGKNRTLSLAEHS